MMINSENNSPTTEEVDRAMRTSALTTSADSVAKTEPNIDRAELIQRMLRDALDETSAVAANLQLNGADLLEMSLVLKSAIVCAAESTHDMKELKELLPFIDMYAKLCRQADRVLRLKYEITPSRPDERIAPAIESILESE
jgi:hypothetical protein